MWQDVSNVGSISDLSKQGKRGQDGDSPRRQVPRYMYLRYLDVSKPDSLATATMTAQYLPMKVTINRRCRFYGGRQCHGQQRSAKKSKDLIQPSQRPLFAGPSSFHCPPTCRHHAIIQTLPSCPPPAKSSQSFSKRAILILSEPLKPCTAS